MTPLSQVPVQLNVLITRSGRACLADFGLATAIDAKTTVMAHNSTIKIGGTIRFQAPELLCADLEETETCPHNSKASDIYAFACVCYEVSCQSF